MWFSWFWYEICWTLLNSFCSLWFISSFGIKREQKRQYPAFDSLRYYTRCRPLIGCWMLMLWHHIYQGPTNRSGQINLYLVFFWELEMRCPKDTLQMVTEKCGKTLLHWLTHWLAANQNWIKRTLWLSFSTQENISVLC